MTEVLNNLYEPVDLLPDEIVISTLIFIDANTLFACRLVCKRWQQLIDTYVFQEKAAQENKFVNNGRGYYSFSQINSNEVRHLDLPWYVFYIIGKYDPFNRNLVKNHCGQNGWKHWKCLQDIQRVPDMRVKLWTVQQLTPRISHLGLPNDPDFDGNQSYFTSELFHNRIKFQKIMFKDYGLNETVMKTLQPEISFSAWFNNGCKCSSKYILQAIVYSRSKETTVVHDDCKEYSPQMQGQWDKASNLFKTTGNESSLTLWHHIKDEEEYLCRNLHSSDIFKISCSVVKILLPIKFKIKSVESKMHI